MNESSSTELGAPDRARGPHQQYQLKEATMKNILFVPSSPRGWKSYSHRAARRVIDSLIERHPDARVVVRDVARQPLPHVGEIFGTPRLLPAEKRSDADHQPPAPPATLVAALFS